MVEVLKSVSEFPVWLPAGLRRPAFNSAPLGLFVGVSVVPAWSLQWDSSLLQGIQESVLRTQDERKSIFNNPIILKVIKHHFCPILFIRVDD